MDPKEQEAAVNDLENKIDRLRALYDQYFLGIEKLEPLIPRKEVDRLLRSIRQESIRNTALRFRFQQQIQRFNTLSTYWGRVARQIEEGTYRRDVMRARARAAEQAAEAGKKKPRIHEVDLSELDEDEPTDPGLSPPEAAFARAPAPAERTAETPMEELLRDARPGPPPRPVPRPPPIPPRPAEPAAGSAHLPEGRVQDIYRQFVAARQRSGEPVAGLSFEKVRDQLRSREADLMKKHGKPVDFDVVLKDGKAVLRAKPRTG